MLKVMVWLVELARRAAGHPTEAARPARRTITPARGDAPVTTLTKSPMDPLTQSGRDFGHGVAGDLMLVDNIRTAHSREADSGPREVLIGVADPVRPADLVDGGVR
jgi:hypothetical protein